MSETLSPALRTNAVRRGRGAPRAPRSPNRHEMLHTVNKYFAAEDWHSFGAASPSHARCCSLFTRRYA